MGAVEPAKTDGLPYQASAKVESDPGLAPEYAKQLKTVGWRHGAADVFYFPKGAREEFLSLAPLFLRHQVYFSNAVPTMIQLISTKVGVAITPLVGSSVWDVPDRTDFAKYLPKKPHDYLHPLKFSKLKLDDPAQTVYENFSVVSMFAQKRKSRQMILMKLDGRWQPNL